MKKEEENNKHFDYENESCVGNKLEDEKHMKLGTGMLWVHVSGNFDNTRRE